MAGDGGARMVPQLGPSAAVDAVAPAMPGKHGLAYAVTGGLGGLGLLMADALAHQAARQVVLTGRSGRGGRCAGGHAALRGPGDPGNAAGVLGPWARRLPRTCTRWLGRRRGRRAGPPPKPPRTGAWKPPRPKRRAARPGPAPPGAPARARTPRPRCAAARARCA